MRQTRPSSLSTDFYAVKRRRAWELAQRRDRRDRIWVCVYGLLAAAWLLVMALMWWG